MKYFWAIVGFLLAAAGIFMIVSLSMASAHGVGMIEEWKNWFGIISEEVEAVSPALKTILKI